MPIKPENRGKYPPNWKSEIRPAILARAGNRCEFCRIANYAVGRRDDDRFHTVAICRSYIQALKFKQQNDAAHRNCLVVIVLTIAHLDHDPTNNDPANLRALCQRCHNRYDVAHRQANRAATVKAKRAQQEMMV